MIKVKKYVEKRKKVKEKISCDKINLIIEDLEESIHCLDELNKDTSFVSVKKKLFIYNELTKLKEVLDTMHRLKELVC